LFQNDRHDRRSSRRWFEKLRPFKELVAEDIADDESDARRSSPKQIGVCATP
jgi:hypothetical protein